MNSAPWGVGSKQSDKPISTAKRAPNSKTVKIPVNQKVKTTKERKVGSLDGEYLDYNFKRSAKGRRSV
jgi:hypothetical protein